MGGRARDIGALMSSIDPCYGDESTRSRTIRLVVSEEGDEEDREGQMMMIRGYRNVSGVLPTGSLVVIGLILRWILYVHADVWMLV